MASRSIGSTYVEMMLKDINFRKGLKLAEKGLNNFAAGAVNVGKKAATGMAVAGAAIAAAMVVGVKRTLEQTDGLVDLSNQTGVAIADMMLLQRAYADGGRSAEMAGKDIGKMQKALTTAQQGGDDPFKALGLSVDELMKKNPGEQFREIGDAIMRISNPAQRTAKAMEIFGKGGMGLLTVFGGMSAAEKSLGRMPQLAEKFGAAMGEANDLIGHLPVKSDQFFMGFTAGVIGELLPALKLIDEKDFTRLGENIGNAVAVGLNTLIDGTAWEIFQLQAEKVANYLRTDFWGGFTNAWAASLNYMIDGYSGYFGTMGDILTNNQGKGGLNIFDSIDRRSTGNSFTDYTQMGIDATAEKNAEADKRIAELIANAAAKASAKSNAAAYGVPPMIAAPIDTLAADGKKAKVGKSTWESSSFDVNDYQKRGLSLAKNPVGMAAEKQITLLADIKEILKRASTNGKLVWD